MIVYLSLFHVVSYLTTDKKINSLFKNVYKHLKTNGLFIFDFGIHLQY